MRSPLTRKKMLLFSFLLPLLIQLAVFAALRITPFGDRGLLFGDASAYSIKDLISFRYLIRGDRSFLYSFSNCLGDSNANLLSHILSPFSWIMLLSGWDYIELCFAMAIVLVTSLYGLTMMFLLCDIWENRLSNLLFSTCYALMGFSVVYNYCIGFFCGPLCLPLMVLGLRKIFRGESGLIYTLSIAYCIACNIQFGLILCTTSLVFFVVKLVIGEGIARKKICVSYVIFSLLGGLLPALFWAPSILGLAGGRASQNSLEDFTFDDNAPILAMFSRLFSGAASISQIIDGLPAIFCGILTVILVIMYFLDKKNSRKNRIAFGVILFLLLLTFYIRFFSTIVHGSHTNWFNYRNSFVFSFVLILIAACEYERIGEVKEKVIRTSILVFVVSSIIVLSQSYEFISGGNILLDFVLLAIMIGGVFFFRRYPERATATSLTLLMLVCTCLQLYVNYFVSMTRIYNGDWKDVIRTEPEYQEAINKKLPMVQAINTADTSFFRMEDEFQLTGETVGNDAILFNYNGLGQTNLSVDVDMASNEAKFGISFANLMKCYYDAGMPAAMDSLLGLKYVITPRDLASEKNYDRRIQGLYPDEGDIYQNPYALSIAMLSEEGISKVDISNEKNVFEVQNKVWKALTGGSMDMFTEETDLKLSMHNPTDEVSFDKEEMLKLPDLTDLNKKDEDGSKADSSESSYGKKNGGELKTEEYLYNSYVEYEFVAKKTGPIYLYDSAAFVEGSGTTDDILQYVGYFHEGDTVVGRILIGYTLTTPVFVATGQGLHIAYADMDALAEYSKLLNSKEVTIEKIIDHHLTGTVNAEKDERLFFTIPYQKGWTLYVDGKEAPLEKTCNLFMSTPITAGAHVYELKFWPPGLTVGIIVSVIALLGLVCTCGYERSNRKKMMD